MLVQADQVVQVEIDQAAIAQADLADHVQAVQVVQVDLAAKAAQVVQAEIARVDLADHVQVALAQDLLAPVRQVELLAAHQAVDLADVQIQLAAEATQLALLESQVADRQRVANQSALSVKSSTT